MELSAEQKKRIIALLNEPKHKAKFKNERYTAESFVNVIAAQLKALEHEYEKPDVRKVPLNDAEKDKLDAILRAATKLNEKLEDAFSTSRPSSERLPERLKSEFSFYFGAGRLGDYDTPSQIISALANIALCTKENYRATTKSSKQLSTDYHARGTNAPDYRDILTVRMMRSICRTFFDDVRPTKGQKQTQLFYKLLLIVSETYSEQERDLSRAIERVSSS